MPVNKDLLQEYVATFDSGKYKSWDEINSKFPELKDVNKDVLQEYVATVKSKKYKSWDEINSKFPEFFPVQSSQSDIEKTMQPFKDAVEKIGVNPTWYVTNTKDNLVKESTKVADFVFGKGIGTPITPDTPSQNKGSGDEVDNSFYKAASFKVLSEINPSGEDLDNPYIMEAITRAKKDLDKEYEEVVEQYKKSGTDDKSRDARILTSFYDKVNDITNNTPKEGGIVNAISRYFNDDLTTEDKLLKKETERQIQIENAGRKNLSFFGNLTLDVNHFSRRGLIPYSWDKYKSKDVSELENINTQIEQLNQLKERKKGESTFLTEEQRLTPNEDIIKSLEPLENRRKELIKSLENDKNKKDLNDLIDLKNNLTSDLQNTIRFHSSVAEQTRTTPEKFVNKNKLDALLELAEYGTTINGSTSTEILEAKTLKFEKNKATGELKNMLAKNINDVNEFTNSRGETFQNNERAATNTVGDKLTFQQDTYTGLLSLRQNALINKNEKYGFPATIRYYEEQKANMLKEAKDKGITLSLEDLQPINNEIIKNHVLLQNQDAILAKLKI